MTRAQGDLRRHAPLIIAFVQLGYYRSGNLNSILYSDAQILSFEAIKQHPSASHYV
jgi:hypothetical protein